jgi:putative FmdB family regulatory protein
MARLRLVTPSYNRYNYAVRFRRKQGEKVMPVYTYRCDNCGVQFEKHQSFTDTPLKTCPECRKKALRKVITPTKIIFKGSGFYATDNKSPSGESSGTKPSKSEEKSESKSESKPEKKTSSESSAE